MFYILDLSFLLLSAIEFLEIALYKLNLLLLIYYNYYLEFDRFIDRKPRIVGRLRSEYIGIFELNTGKQLHYIRKYQESSRWLKSARALSGPASCPEPDKENITNIENI